MQKLALDFEKPILEMESQIEKLKQMQDFNVQEEINNLEQKCQERLQEIFSQLTPWQITQLARHPARPYATDYLQSIFNDFTELHGDRLHGDDAAIIGGLARFEQRPVVIVAQQKGRDTKERTQRNFGMARPEGYRKALRLFRLAERFGLPVITFIDTPGAYPGIDAEKYGQSEAIARNLLVLSQLKTPIVSVVLGEGGSGGALAIAVADVVLMLQYSIYSVISPEGCAAILWKSPEKTSAAAEALGLTAQRLQDFGLIDGIVPEPLGGAHRDAMTMAQNLREHLRLALKRLDAYSCTALLERRYQRLQNYGEVERGAAAAPERL